VLSNSMVDGLDHIPFTKFLSEEGSFDTARGEGWKRMMMLTEVVIRLIRIVRLLVFGRYGYEAQAFDYFNIDRLLPPTVISIHPDSRRIRTSAFLLFFCLSLSSEVILFVLSMAQLRSGSSRAAQSRATVVAEVQI
jgi:hypothetical protein